MVNLFDKLSIMSGLEINNSSDGNCMYYAYSISLMYFLRAKNNIEITEDIFNKLNLKEEHKILLRNLLSIDADTEFSREEIKTIIEPVLGSATRNLAAERTKTEFLTKPDDTSLFTAINYGLEFVFRWVLLENKKSNIAELISLDLNNQDFTEAEIYKVPGIEDKLIEFVQTNIPAVIERFEQESKKQGLIKAPEEKNTVEEETVLDLAEVQKQQEIILHKILCDLSIEFFTNNDNKFLEEYITYLKKDKKWGTEETLMHLNRAIQGERAERNPDDSITILRDTEIQLHLYIGGQDYLKLINKELEQRGIPDIIVNHVNENHWTSIIPETIFTPKPAEKDIKPSETPKEMQTEVTDITSEITTSVSENITHPDSNSSATKEMPYIQTEVDFQEMELKIKYSKIQKAIDAMKIARDIIPNYHQEYSIANNLVKELSKEIERIKTPKATIKDMENTVRLCINIIGQAKPSLGKYQSWRTAFHNFFSALLEYIPAFLGGNKIRSGLQQCGLYSEDRRSATIRIIESLETSLKSNDSPEGTQLVTTSSTV